MANKYWVANAPNSSKITKEEAGSISDILISKYFHIIPANFPSVIL